MEWNVVEKFFEGNKNFIAKHHLESYNSFFNNGLKQIFKENNPLRFFKEQDSKTNIYRYQCKMYLGGKEGNRIYFGKPIIYDKGDRTHFMYPNEARLRNMTYAFSIHYDVEVDFTIYDDDGEELKREGGNSLILEKIYLGRFPIMLGSNLCILDQLSKEVRFNMGECRNDPGGYFIINGKEKVIISQEKFANNTIYVRDNVNDLYSHSVEIRSVSEDPSKPVRTLNIRIVRESEQSTNGHIVVNVPNVRKPVPLFILMRALGIESDKEIIQTCLLDLNKNEDMIELFRSSIHDAGYVFTQQEALKFIATLTKGKTVPHVLEILMIYFLPHIGELNFKQKSLFLGYMTYRMLCVFIKLEKPTDRDNFKYKRIELSGMLIYDLFREYYNLQKKNIFLKIDKEYFYSKTKQKTYQNLEFIQLITNNVSNIFADRIVEEGFRKAFKGNWGATAHTKRLGVLQDLSRLSFFSSICQMRKLNLPFDASAKITGPRLLHGTQWGIICPIHTPDGGNVGLHKHLAIATHITSVESGYPYIKLLRELGMNVVEECTYEFLCNSTKIFVNGGWVGNHMYPERLSYTLKQYRRTNRISIYTSVSWIIAMKEIYLWTDGGRPCRPLFYMDEEPSVKLINTLFDWSKYIHGERERKAAIEFIDTEEAEMTMIAMNVESIKEGTTHIEIHPSLALSMMANHIVFPENNPLPRDLFSCGQSKQAVSVYHSNFQNRIDKSGLVLNYGQIPLVKSRYFKYVTKEEHPYGVNVIVAIMCYSGYNVEDAIIMNGGSLARGLFRTTYYNMYEAVEESNEVGGKKIETFFCDSSDTIRRKMGYDYGHLDSRGLVKVNTQLNDKIVVIGKCVTNQEDVGTFIDASIGPKKGQLGFVDKVILTTGENGHKLAKIRIREERIPAIGDKFVSRVGQKGTVGIVLPEEDMPFTENGIRPDIIVNPHAFPSRMTLGQLIETIMGKACLIYGGHGDCTAFVNKGPKDAEFGRLLSEVGLHSSGNQILYNGMTGEQLETDIFIGPTYYMRLKHMVKDKINYRAKGPRNVLTRQTVQGRANNGGLRIGEMDRDAILGHGMGTFIQESFLGRGDEYFLAICNMTGAIAIYNQVKKVFISPMADGPVHFIENLDGKLNIENISKFGRDFSIIRIPYALKLLYQELKTMNIQMRFITDKNIDQLNSMLNDENAIRIRQIKGYGDLKETIKVSKDTFSSEKECKASLTFVPNEEYKNVSTDIPYALNDKQLKKMVSLDAKLVAHHLPKSNIFKGTVIEKDLNQLRSWKNVDKKNTLEYMFHKIRSGYYIGIRGGRVYKFVPFYNLQYENDWATLVNANHIKKRNQDKKKWVATNCLLHLNFRPLVDKYKMDTFMEVKNMFDELCDNRNIPDVDLFINPKDFPLQKKDGTHAFNHIYGKGRKAGYTHNYPILSFNSNNSFLDIPIPTNHEWQSVTQEIFLSRCQGQYINKDLIDWDEKKPIAVFRGSGTGCSLRIERNPRLKIAELDKKWRGEKLLNAGITKLPRHIVKEESYKKVYDAQDPSWEKKYKNSISCAAWGAKDRGYMSLHDQSRFKYILNIEGNSAAYRLSHLMTLGSVVMNVETENKLWWERLWKDGEEYVKISRKLESSLKGKIKWCQDNDDQCKVIAEKAKTFSEKYLTRESIYDYLEMVIHNIVSKGADKVKKGGKYRINIIVPFRENDPNAKGRTQHLKKFKKRMGEFLPEVMDFLDTKHGRESEFDITVIEQSEDHKFNRGALLNIGFKQDETYDAYIFHDVDLLPKDKMISAYAGPYAEDAIVHLASEWTRWKNHYKFLGGVLLVGREMFERVNGFPNNFFGWGGEDDELRRRFETVLGKDLKKYVTLAGKKGGLEDLENIKRASDKTKKLKEKNPVRWEGKARHADTWEDNGLNQTDFYEILSQDEETISKITYKRFKIGLKYDEILPFEEDEQLEEKRQKK